MFFTTEELIFNKIHTFFYNSDNLKILLDVLVFKKKKKKKKFLFLLNNLIKKYIKKIKNKNIY